MWQGVAITETSTCRKSKNNTIAHLTEGSNICQNFPHQNH